MPPQPAARCCRAVQHQISTPLESIWITDSALCQAFERYCSISKVAKRRASSVPGPLENRRRLGKRNIAELNSLQSHSALPAWALPNAVDLSQWTWEPPSTSPAIRFQKDQKAAPSKWPLPAVRLPDWLVGLAGEREVVVSDKAKTQQVQRSEPMGDMSLRGELEILASTASSMSATSFVQSFQTFCGHFQQQLVLGLSQGIDISEVLRLALEALDAKLEKSPHKELVRTQYLTLLESVVDGIKFCRVLEPSAFPSDIWQTLLVRLSEQPVSDDFCNLFLRVMDIMPSKYVEQSTEDWLSILGAVFRDWRTPDDWSHKDVTSHLGQAVNASQEVDMMISSIELHLIEQSIPQARALLVEAQLLLSGSRRSSANAANAMSSHQRQIESVSAALRGLSPEQHMESIRTATDLASLHAAQGSLAPEAQHQIQYNWLRVLARLPGINQDYLFEASSSMFSAEGSLPLSNVELCQVLLDHWTSRGYLKNATSVQDTFKIFNGTNDTTAIACLVSTLHKRRRPNDVAGYLYSLWKYLRCLEREDEFIASLKALKQLRGISPRVIKNVAFTSDDHRVALELHSLSTEYFHKRHLQWGPGFWDKFMDSMAVDPAVEPKKLLQMLAIEPGNMVQNPGLDLNHTSKHLETQAANKSVGRVRRNFIARQEPAQVARVQKAAMLLSQAPHVRNRVALRHVQRCIRYLGYRNRRWSVTEITAVARILTRDLTEGQPGRTERLRWLLRLVADTFGERVALQCGLHLKRWRNGNWRLLQQSK